MIQLSFSNALSCGVQSLPFSQNFFHRAHKSFELTLRLSPIFQENCVFSYLKHRCSHTGKFHTECFSVLYAFSCDCCIGLHHFLSHHITYTERVCHCILYWCSPNFSWLGNLFEHMLQTQSILMLEIILHN